VRAIVQTVNRTQKGFSLSVNLKNVTSGTINIFAGPAHYDTFYQNFPNSQLLRAGASDERGQQYFLESMQGFARAKDAYFSGNNFFMQLDPGESSSATFVFEFSNMYSGSEPANFINVNVELAIVASSQSRGNHRVRSLVLTRQRLE
jgi:hypothetical protein